MAKFLMVLVMVTALAIASGCGESRASGLKLESSRQLDARLTELTFSSPSLAEPVKVRVLVPREAAAHPGARYPVLYLLHGSDRDSAFFTQDIETERLTEGMGVVVVMPDGGAEG